MRVHSKAPGCQKDIPISSIPGLRSHKNRVLIDDLTLSIDIPRFPHVEALWGVLSQRFKSTTTPPCDRNALRFHLFHSQLYLPAKAKAKRCLYLYQKPTHSLYGYPCRQRKQNKDDNLTLSPREEQEIVGTAPFRTPPLASLLPVGDAPALDAILDG